MCVYIAVGHGCWVPNPGSLKERPGRLKAEQSPAIFPWRKVNGMPRCVKRS